MSEIDAEKENSQVDTEARAEERVLKMVNHFTERLVKPEIIKLIRGTQDLINHITERVAIVVSRVSPENPVDKDVIINYYIYLTLTKTGLNEEELKKLTLMTGK